MSSHDLTDALRLVADADRPVPDAGDDLARARSAQRRRTVGRLGLGSAAATLLVFIAVGVTALQHNGTPEQQLPPIHLVSAHLTTRPYTFGVVPRGWTVQGQTPDAVTIAPEHGATSPSPDVFVGKLVIMFDEEPTFGQPVKSSGRVYWIHSDAGYTTISTRTRPDEPHGVVRVQYPDQTRWSRWKMLAFLRSVHVNPGVQPGHG